MDQDTRLDAHPDNRQAAAFDLIIEGIGYLNRIRAVTPKKGPAYTACTINAMMGTADAVEYVSIDCRIVGKLALESVKQLKGAVAAKSKVIVGFRAGDPRPEFYEYKDSKTGEDRSGQGLKARLLQLTFAKVDGNKVEIPLVAKPTDARPSDLVVEQSGDTGAGSACEDTSRTPAEA